MENSGWGRKAVVLQRQGREWRGKKDVKEKNRGDECRRRLMRGRLGASDGQGSGRGFRRAVEVLVRRE